ncbi:MAG: hypothetical protein K2L73_05510 [Muribaculaceae bacterium]|nr:hypothetical protein [Muribaculaceae bacterium]
MIELVFAGSGKSKEKGLDSFVRVDTRADVQYIGGHRYGGSGGEIFEHVAYRSYNCCRERTLYGENHVMMRSRTSNILRVNPIRVAAATILMVAQSPPKMLLNEAFAAATSHSASQLL